MEEWTELKIEKDSRISSGKIIRLLADENIPSIVVDELSNAGLKISTIKDHDLLGRSDAQVLQAARIKNLILFTTDKDFWDESKHPIQSCKGIVISGYGPEQPEKIIDSMAFFHALFMKHWPLEWWERQKALLKTNSFHLRMRTFEGKVEEDEYQLKKGKIMTRKIM